ncbi:dihydrofolate reductase family protein [Geitlerinema sp. PCC 7407]|uniref:dihydrofolate reductase family protein n=1 Tax=Geitlerinema sp. PCC 7407 TaxID=1173025 RepID=UPI00029FEAD5|nr:dihydrofolate reductase family protein [Geitlerinema sp. PCC 7407]AFY66378.1 bifunctional deaminase-reductase domain protein [Geitlerinema sp. PCC 7407]
MRTINLFIATSLDGYIARKNGEVDWLFTDQDYGYTAFFDEIETLLMGRRTYEQLLTFGEYPYGTKEAYVFSRGQRDRTEQVNFVAQEPASFVRDLKGRPGGDIWLVGGAVLVRELLAAKLVDRLILSIHPVVLGEGLPLFLGPLPEIPLTLIDHHTFETGLVQLTYESAAA